MKTLMTVAGVAAVAVAYVAAPAQAYILNYTSVVEGAGTNPAGFQFSYWHEATGCSGKCGDVIAVFGDNPDGTQSNPASGTYNTEFGGVLNLTMGIYLPATPLNNQLQNPAGVKVGEIVLNGNLGPVANFNNDNNAILGALAWTATFDDNVNSVITWLTGNGFAATSIGGGQFEVSGTHFFNDKEYVGDGPNTNDPNSIAIDEGSDPVLLNDNTAIMALWGGSLAQPSLRTNGGPTGGYVFTTANTTLGIDLMLNLEFGGGGSSLPEPTSLALLGHGLVGIGFASRRRQK